MNKTTLRSDQAKQPLSKTTAYWDFHGEFVPRDGQIVVYSDGGSYTLNGETVVCPKLKIGDGVRGVTELPFVGKDDVQYLLSIINTSGSSTESNMKNLSEVAASALNELNRRLNAIEGKFNGGDYIEVQKLKVTRELIAGLAAVAMSGNYDDLTNKPSLFSGSYNDLTDKPTLFSGNYNDLTNKPTIPAAQVNSDWNATEGVAKILNKPTLFSGSYNDLTDKPTLFSGNYNDLTNKPTIPAAQVNSDWNATGGVAKILNKPTLFSGSYNDLTDKPTLFSGNYNDLTNKPTIPAAQVNSDWDATEGVAKILNKPTLFSGSYNDLTDKPTLFSGNYNDLTNKPTIPAAQVNSDWNATEGVAKILNKPTLFSGSYNDLTDKPTLFSGNYNDLTNKPTIPAAQVNSDWNATEGVAKILNKPTLFSGSYNDLTDKPTLFSGNYNDLTNKPTIPAAQVNSDWNATEGVAKILNKPTLFSGSYNDLTDKPTLFSGNYNDLTNKPTIPAAQVNSDWDATEGVAKILNKPTLFSGSYNDLTDKPTLFSGNYNDLTNKPSLFSGSYNDLTDKPTLFSGNYNDLTNKPSLFSGSYNDLTDKPTLFSGNYNDLTNKPTIPAAQVNSDWNATEGVAKILNKPTLFSGSYNDLTDKPTLFSGNYNDLTNKPTIPAAQVNSDWDATEGVAKILNKPTLFSGSYNDLTDKPTLFSGNYNDLTNKPSLFSGSYNDLTDKPTLFSGNYNDLTNKPTIPAAQVNSDWNATEGVAKILNKPTLFSGSYNDLTDKPTLFSGNYNDLTNKPTIPAAQVNSDWNATGGVAKILNKPTLFSGSYNDLTDKPTLFSGNYNDLTNKPTIPAAQVNSDWDATEGVAKILNKPTLFSGSYNDLTDKPTLFSGNYNDLTNKPTIPAAQVNSDWNATGGVAKILNKPTLFSGSYNDLTDKPTLFSGNYNDLTNKPTIPAAQVNSDWDATEGVAKILNKPTLFSGSYNDLTDKPTLFSGNYNDLTNKPSLFSGSYNDLTDKPTLFSGNYNDLTNKPTIPAAQVNSDWNATEGVAKILNKPTLFSGSYNDLTDKPTLFSGNYNDLTNKPTIPAAQVNSDWNATEGVAKILNKPTLFSGSYNDLTDKPTLFSGNYNDLTNKPTIPAAQVNSDWNATEGVAKILNKPTIPTVPTNVSDFNNDAGYISQYSVIYCDTASATRNKEGKCPLSSLTAESYYVVMMVNENTYSSNYIRLNVNGIGNKGIYINGEPSGSSNYTLPAGIYIVYYDGYYFYFRTDGKIPLKNAAFSGSYNELADKPTLFSGNYNDLTNKPTIPAAQVNSDWNATEGVAKILNKPTLFSGSYNDLTDKPTLFSGNYNDLTNKPTIPAAQVNSDWNATEGVAKILNKPTIPTVPTNVSDFNNDAGYISQYSVIYCDTASATRNKEGKCPLSSLTAESYYVVMMVNENTYSSNYIRLNVNGIGNKGIYINGEPSGSSNYTLPAGIYIVYYDGYYFYFRTDGKIPLKNAAFSGSYNELADKPTLFSGNYNDLTNKPTIPAAQVNSDWNATEGVAKILNKPTLFSGSYNDLTDKPTLFSGNYNDLTNKPTIHISTVECATSSGTAIKVGQCTNFTLKDPCYVFVKMHHANSAATSIGLNINYSGSKRIYINGEESSSTNNTLPAGTYIVYFDGTNYHFRTDGKLPIAGGAFGGSYNDLTDKPSLATVATSGDYNDLSNTPDIPYTTVECPTVASTANKRGVCTNFSLKNPCYVIVKMHNSNTASGNIALTLNINYTGQKVIYINGALSGNGNQTLPAGTYIVYYDGTNYHFRTDGKLPISGGAFSGSYNDLTDKPTLFSGNYNDLTNKPTIPAAQVNSDWNATEGVAKILNKPTIPTVPTNVSDFNNDAGYISQYSVIYCDTASATRNKEGKCPLSSLTAESYYVVMMVNENTYSSNYIRLNVNGIGNKGIYINGEPSGSSNYTLPAGIYIVYYDGRYFYFRTDGKIPLKNAAFSGSYNELADKPTINKFDYESIGLVASNFIIRFDDNRVGYKYMTISSSGGATININAPLNSENHLFIKNTGSAGIIIAIGKLNNLDYSSIFIYPSSLSRAGVFNIGSGKAAEVVIQAFDGMATVKVFYEFAPIEN